MSGRPWWNVSGHGTPARLQRHYRDGDKPCEACLDSVRERNAAAMRAWRRARAEEAYRASVEEWRAEYAVSVARQQERDLRALIGVLAGALAGDAGERRRAA